MALLCSQLRAHRDLTGIHGFDFLVGEWRVHHRRISALSKKWVELDGTLSLRLLMEGVANMEEHWLNSPDGVYRAVGLRSYDSKQDQWSIWCLAAELIMELQRVQ